MPDAKKKSDEKLIRISGKIKKKNPYYLKVADRYRATAFILILTFVIYIGVMLVKYGEYITYDNLVYLVRDFDAVLNLEKKSFSDISYAAQENMDFELFRQGVAVAGNNSVTLYDSSGAELCSESENFSNPTMTSSDKYLLVYDMGGVSYSIYNSLTKITSRKTEKEIIGADMSDSGDFIITTRSDSGKFVVEYYNSAFKRKMSIHKDKYVLDAAISRDGNRIAIASATEGSISLGFELSVCEAGKSEPAFTQNFENDVPLMVEYTKEGTLIALSENKISFYDSSLNVINSTDIKGMTPAFSDVSDGGAILVCRENALGNKNRIYAFDVDGNILYNNVIDSRILSAAAPNDRASGAIGYVGTPSSIIKLMENGEDETVEVNEEALDMFDMGSGLAVCTVNKAFRLFGATLDER